MLSREEAIEVSKEEARSGAHRLDEHPVKFDLERVALDALDELGKELGNDIVPGSMLEAKLYHLEQAIRTLFRAPEQNTAAPPQTLEGYLHRVACEQRNTNVNSSQPASAVPLPEAPYLKDGDPLTAWHSYAIKLRQAAIRLQAQLEEARLQRDSHAFERLAAERTVGELTDALAACVSSLDHLMAFKGSRLEETQREGHLLNIKRGRAALARKEGT